MAACYSEILFCSAARLRHPKRAPIKRLTSSQYMQQSLAVQTRQLQVDRKKVQLLQEISSSMSVIAAELINLRALYTTVNGFEFTTVIPEQ